MAATTFSILVTAQDGETPFEANADTAGITLRNWFHKRLSGTRGSGDTVVVNGASARASGTVTAAAVQNADTVTINGVVLTATQKHARGTITPTVSGIDVDDTLVIKSETFTAKKHHSTGTVTITAAGVDNGDVVVINGATFTAAAAENTATGAFDVSGTDTAAATSLAACITASVDPLVAGIVTATSAAGVVTIRMVATGIGTVTLTSDDAQLAVSGAGTLTAGTVPAAGEFDISGSNAQTCTSILAAINANLVLPLYVTASTTSTVVTVRSLIAGTAGNYVLTSSDAQLAVSGAGTMTGGASVANAAFDFGGTNAETAADLARCINACTTDLIEFHATATVSDAIVTVLAKTPGHAGNAVTLASSDNTRLAVSVARLAGGAPTATFTY